MFQGFVACGGFSYGDTLGAGEGWARSILFNPQLAEQFAAFFARADTFALGVCNGCQMMAALSPHDPGRAGLAAASRATAASSSRRGCRWSRCSQSPSIFFSGMAGSRIPIAVAHGEGFADFSQRGDATKVHAALRFVDHHGRPTEAYPAQPERQPGRPDRGDDGRRPLHRADAAPRARVPQRADELDRRRSQRSEPVDADVRQRAPLPRLARRGANS